MFAIIRKSKDTVVGTYLDVIKSVCEETGAETKNVAYKSKCNRKNDILVSEEALVTMYYLLRGYKNIVTWLQGVVPEESFMRNKSKLRYLFLSGIEYITLARSKMLFFVSNTMLEHYEKKYKLKLREKSIIMPCYNETKIIENSFKAENKYEENNFVYVGGMQKWQCFDKIAEIYKRVEEICGDTKFYVFTAQKETAENTIKNLGIKNYEIDFVPHDKLAEKLGSMKYGFVIREDTTVNRVATPTKFSNYLANGIIPIYSSCLKSFAEFDSENKLGIAYDGDVKVITEHMKKNLETDEIKRKCQNAFDTYYNAEKYKEIIRNKLSEIFAEL